MAQKAQKEVITMNLFLINYLKGQYERETNQEKLYELCDKIMEEQIRLDEYLTNQERDEYDFWLKLSEF